MMSSSEAAHHSASFSFVCFLLYFTRKFDLRLSTFLFLLFLAYLDGPRGKGYLVFVKHKQVGGV